ncbi:MAG: tetrapyrrole methylase family protein / MazG family protein [Sphaerochaeta sp.]|jgi:MazG family protein|nr:tetrapyrrole methylase family protein / MazG family protein [Sphaerochaeta sp.]MDN5333430.1 tetrapyrrole methylase family protein / MazG family protein [Sphaerochaeta sp.]
MYMIDFTFEKKASLQDALMQLHTIVTLLRSKNGCPWDREQTSKSVAENLLDETYEYIDEVIKHDQYGQREELGDVLLNTMMLLEIHEEQDGFSVVESLNDVCEKLIRRHPHVFSTAEVSSSGEVIDLWNTIKTKVEGKQNTDDDFFSRVPTSLPPLEMANEIQKKIRKVGFDWPNVDGVVEKVEEELSEVLQAKDHQSDETEDLEMELGDLLFAVVNLTRFLGYNPSVALHRSNQKMRNRFNALYQIAKQKDISLNKEHLEEMDQLWQEVKSEETRSKE